MTLTFDQHRHLVTLHEEMMKAWAGAKDDLYPDLVMLHAWLLELAQILLQIDATGLDSTAASV